MAAAERAVRTAGLDDVAAVRDIYRRSSLSNEGDRAVLLAHPDALELDATAIRLGHTRVALDGSTIVGFATIVVHDATAELEDLFVDPDHMRQGIARLLIADAVARARSSGVGRIGVTANEHAHPFYSAVGFVPDGTAETRFGPAARFRLDIAG